MYATKPIYELDLTFDPENPHTNFYQNISFPSRVVVRTDGQLLRCHRRISAFLWDSTQLEVESAKDCDLVVSSHSLGRSGYVVGLQKKSRWTDSVNEALLDFSEDGTLLELDRKWIVSALFNSECEKPGSEPARLGLKNMAGVFILVAAGIVGGVALIGIEILFKRHYSRQQRQIELTRHAFDKWKNMRRKMLRGTIENQRRSKLNGSLPNFTIPGESIDTSNADGIFVIGEGRYFDV
ncbi:glutamate [NMDA] receptor subunit 1-like [Artemia franciscana]|uniref:glutamate [NMDA] receptor subunit 1-like n=1 Tax=Artemia franciscana TaxID=6661 RepID=UPI0032DAE47E